MPTQRLDNLKKRVEELAGRKKTFEEMLEGEQKKLDTSTALAGECESALKLLELVGTTSRERIKQEIETLVTHALASTFSQDDYSFVAEFLHRRNQIECDLLLGVGDKFDETFQTMDPLDSNGGGIVDVITTALRFVLLTMLHQEGPSVLDEPGKFVSAGHQRAFLNFIQEFSEKTNRQVIMSTHIENYMSPSCKIVRMELDDNRQSVIDTSVTGSNGAETKSAGAGN